MGLLDLALLRTLIVVVFSAIVGVWVKDLWERRPRLIAYLWNASAIQVPAAGGNPAFTVHTHTVVIRNSGRRTSTNVRLGHQNRPFWYSVYPDGLHTERALTNGAREIEFPRLVRDQQVTITYLYYFPTVWQEINTHIQDDHGNATVRHVIPSPVLPRWLRAFLVFVLGCGLVSILYVAVSLLRAYWPALSAIGAGQPAP